MNERSNCPTRLIEDTPAQEDLLSQDECVGPHERLAVSIADLIQNPDECGGKMIGIEGSWGTGKTTVVNLLQKALEKNDQITTFPFDAWAHEGDPLRRTFLESLIKHFQSLGNWIDRDYWNEELEKLSKRKITTSIRTVPEATPLGNAFAVSIVLMAIGSPFLSSSLQRGITIDTDLPISFSFLIGLPFTIAPILVFLWNVLRIWYKKRFKGLEDATAWAFLTQQVIRDTTQDTIQTPAPTSIEFENVFEDLMEKCLSRQDDRKVILIIDNLDRVTPEQALSIWGTLQTFLQNRNFQNQPWFKKIWLIVPYDPSGLKKLWGNFNSNSILPTEDRQDLIVLDSFIDKSFQIRFEVPPLVLSNWRKFLVDLFAKALPSHKERGKVVYQIYNHGRKKDGEAPTPRELKLFVNQIGALYRQWGDHFPIDHLAYYVSLKRRNRDIKKDLQDGNLPEQAIEALVEPGLRDNLAGLTFNVEAELGLQFLLTDPIRDALTERKPQDLVKLEEVHGTGFWAVLDEVLREKLTVRDAKFVGNSAWCLRESRLLEDVSDSEILETISLLGKAGREVTEWKPFEKNLSEGCASLLRLISNPNFTKRILERVQQTISKIEIKGEEKTTTHGLLEGIVILLEVIQSLNHSEQLKEPFSLKVDAEAWENICVQMLSEKPSLLEKLKPQIRGNDISNYISKSVNDGEFSGNKLKVIVGTQLSPLESHWDILAGPLEKRLDAAQGFKISGKELTLLLEAFSLLRRYKSQKAIEASGRICNPGHLLHYFSQAISEADSYCKAYCLVTYLQQTPDAQKPKAIANSEDGHTHLMNLLGKDDADLANNIINILKEEENLSILLNVADKRKQYDPLIVRCLRILASEEPASIYNSEVLIDRWQGLLENLDEDEPKEHRFEDLVRYLCENDDLPNNVMISHEGFQPQAATLYLTLLKVGETDSFKDWCVKGLRNLNDEEWLKEIKLQGDLLQLLFYLQHLGLTLRLTFMYKDALLNHAKELMDGESELSADLLARKTDLLNAMEPQYRIKDFPQFLLDLAKEKNGELSKDFLDMYGDEIADAKLLSEDNEVVRRLFLQIIINQYILALNWLKNTLFKNKEKLHIFQDKPNFQEFKDRLQSYIDGKLDMNSESEPLIHEIASLMELEPQSDQQEKDNSTSRHTEESETDES